ncbi:MAG: hypothetical protein KDM91_23075 [Verrucomicrobiae bacterium]|nr:hypothetical protein [Verrucomicrobiae bacterium]MCP5541854.1 hypothetical protein [Akkermansiaceae bacterium]
MSKVAAALAWYSREEYSKFLDAADDPEVWDSDYESWRSKAEESIRKLAAMGVEAVRVSLTLEETEEWCRKRGKRNDGSARSELAVSKLRTQTR